MARSEFRYWGFLTEVRAHVLVYRANFKITFNGVSRMHVINQPINWTALTGRGPLILQLLLVAVMSVLLTLPSCAQDQRQSSLPDNSVATELSGSATGGVVVIDGKKLFVVQTGLGPFSADVRAKNIAKRINRLVSDPDLNPESIELIKTDSGVDLLAGDLIIMSVTAADGRSAGREPLELAGEYREILAKALADHKAKRSLEEALEDVSARNFFRTLNHLLLEPTTLKFAMVLIGAIAISIAVRVIQRSVGSFVKDSSRRYASRKVATFVGYILVFVLTMVVFRDALGNLAVIVGATTAAIAFALKEVIVSLAGWFAVTFGDFYKVGDRIQLGGIKGDVIDIGFARTTLMELGEWVNGDLYTGRIVRVANSFIFTQPMFNYSGDFPFIWDEIVIPVKYGCDHALADEILRRVVGAVSGDFVDDAQAHWSRIEKKYLVENARTEPMITMVLNDNWIEFTIRYVVDFKRRRLTKDALFRQILEEVNKTNGLVQFASATFHLVEAPKIDVRIEQNA